MSGIAQELRNENLILKQKLNMIHGEIDYLKTKIDSFGTSVTTNPIIIEFLDDFYEICCHFPSDEDYDSDSDTDEYARVSPTGIHSETTFWRRNSNTGRLQSND